ncbi:hypothetical protein RSG63_004206 [Yersinia enterocolitica]|nr:hypothetical protein [Yersinia enterocolitica]ELI8374830.1 hypothetical protein [Yersinia enterocolitica]
MSKLSTDSLVFHPADEKPKPDMDGKTVLLLNPCDGYHIGYVRDSDGYTGIYTWLMSELTPHDFYVAWVLLPDDIDVSNKFEDQRKSRLY